MNDARLPAYSAAPSAAPLAADANTEVDILVIGGGIVGAGVARDAAMRGLSVLLVEQHDFASGTSSRSTRLFHGGIRYLAQGRLGLVYESGREKRILQKIASHLYAPLEFIFPTYAGTYWPRWKLSFGVRLYDFLCRVDEPQAAVYSPAAMQLRIPPLRSKGLTGGVRYYDAMTSDARLVIDTLRSARRHGASIGNYVRFRAAIDRGHCYEIELEDAISGQPMAASARTIINAAGAWADQFPQSRTQLRRTKGVHLVIDGSRLPLPGAVVMTSARRILFAIPHGRRTILGTTDTDYDGPLDDIAIEARDLDEILTVVNAYFPSARITSADILSAWAGLRPLVADRRGRPSDVSRKHEIHMTKPGWWDVTGGKLTTYRLMAEQTIDRVRAYLKLPQQASQTAHEPLLADDEFRVHSAVIPADFDPAIVEHAVCAEWALALDDVMTRRTGWRYYHPQHLDLAEKSSHIMARLLGWQEPQRAREVAAYRQSVATTLAQCGSKLAR